MRTLVAATLVLSLFTIPVLGIIIEVPGDYGTIQDAIDAAGADDTIIVYPGTYKENLTIDGGSIHLASAYGPEQTVLDGLMGEAVVSFRNDSKASIQGFTITNGKGHDYGGYTLGGGIFCSQSSPKILDNIIQGNEAFGGGGIYCGEITDGPSAPVIENNIIRDNKATFGSGGGIHLGSSSAVISNCLIHDNTAQSGGGGVSSFSSTFFVMHTTFTGNEALNHRGGALYVYKGSICEVIHSILWDNEGPAGHEIAVESQTQPSDLGISYSDVEGGQADVYIEPNCTLTWGLGMIDADPLFLDAANDDYHLTQDPPQTGATSPAVDAGKDNTAQTEVAYCFTRDDAWPDEGKVDLGYHYGPALKVDVTNVPESTGGKAWFRIETSPTQAGRTYILMGGVTGVTPGTQLPKGLILPLNFDIFTMVAAQNINTIMFNDFMAVLDAEGTGHAHLDTLGPMPPGAAGVTLYWAFFLKGFDYTSNWTSFIVSP